MMKFNIPGREVSIAHVGNTLGMARSYIGDGVGFDGVYYWDEAEGAIKSDMADDMFHPYMERTIDATQEIQYKATQWLRAKVMSYIPGLVSSHSDNRAREFRSGDKVRVVRGRKIKKGTEGIVFWCGSTRFGVSTGIRFSDRKDSTGKWADCEFTSPSNLELVSPPTLSLTDAQIESICKDCATMGAYPTLYKNVEYSVRHHLGITQY